MKILMITGTPHKKGTCALLVEKFIEGAKENNHEVNVFEGGFKKVHACIGCEKCERGVNPCVFNDDMNELYPLLFNADMVVFVTPLYYLGMSAQLKTVIDRFHAVNDTIRKQNKKAMLIVTAGSHKDYMMEGIVPSYKVLLEFLHWENAGILLAKGVYYRHQIEESEYPRLAYELGKSIK